MRQVELIKGVRSSALGFGCAPILGSVDGKKAKRALECALEQGINYFDVARSYGYGEAESFLGSFLKNKRQHVVIASKFGIKANWKASLLRPVKPLLRLALEKIKKAEPEKNGTVVETTKVAADRFHYRIPLNEKEMVKSLEETLKALRTEYLDYFFIHEPKEHLYLIDELNATAAKLKDEGKIRGWGLAYMREQEALHTTYLQNFELLQFNCAYGSGGYEEVVKKRGHAPNVIFSALRGGSKEMLPGEKLQHLFVDFPKSVILCSMFNERHIISNSLLV
jgi:aryl-alcohol dehydrogenase-like predicted oxidoreductase